MVTGYNSQDFARKARKIMVDIDKHEINKNDIKTYKKYVVMLNILKTLLKYMPKNEVLKKWHSYCKSVRKRYPIVLPEYKRQKKTLL